MLGVYKIESDRIAYIGNKLHEPIDDVRKVAFERRPTEYFLSRLANDNHCLHLHNIDNAIFFSTVEYFKSIGADWCNLPITTKMISSPGEVYAGKKLDYTTDALPVTLSWFDEGEIFLAESSQFYLELRLLINGLDKVFSVYNSFRKEHADFSHLSEFQHIEFEGHVNFDQNIKIYINLLRHITKYILKNNIDDLKHYLTDDEINELSISFDEKNIEIIRFKDAMRLLANELNSQKYLSMSLKDFGSFEEVALTRIIGKHCNVVEFPLEEIPFYHDQGFKAEDGKLFAKNADFILLGYREVVGSGQRITDLDAIRKKAEYFNLPKEDYEPYIEMRGIESYKSTCGFGLGWQRYVQWLLKLPFIWEASHIPRGHFKPKP